MYTYLSLWKLYTCLNNTGSSLHINPFVNGLFRRLHIQEHNLYIMGNVLAYCFIHKWALDTSRKSVTPGVHEAHKAGLMHSWCNLFTLRAPRSRAGGAHRAWAPLCGAHALRFSGIICSWLNLYCNVCILVLTAREVHYALTHLSTGYLQGYMFTNMPSTSWVL